MRPQESVSDILLALKTPIGNPEVGDEEADLDALLDGEFETARIVGALALLGRVREQAIASFQEREGARAREQRLSARLDATEHRARQLEEEQRRAQTARWRAQAEVAVLREQLAVGGNHSGAVRSYGSRACLTAGTHASALDDNVVQRRVDTAAMEGMAYAHVCSIPADDTHREKRCTNAIFGSELWERVRQVRGEMAELRNRKFSRIRSESKERFLARRDSGRPFVMGAESADVSSPVECWGVHHSPPRGRGGDAQLSSHCIALRPSSRLSWDTFDTNDSSELATMEGSSSSKSSAVATAPTDVAVNAFCRQENGSEQIDRAPFRTSTDAIGARGPFHCVSRTVGLYRTSGNASGRSPSLKKAAAIVAATVVMAAPPPAQPIPQKTNATSGVVKHIPASACANLPCSSGRRSSRFGLVEAAAAAAASGFADLAPSRSGCNSPSPARNASCVSRSRSPSVPRVTPGGGAQCKASRSSSRPRFPKPRSSWAPAVGHNPCQAKKPHCSVVSSPRAEHGQISVPWKASSAPSSRLVPTVSIAPGARKLKARAGTTSPRREPPCNSSMTPRENDGIQKEMSGLSSPRTIQPLAVRALVLRDHDHGSVQRLSSGSSATLPPLQTQDDEAVSQALEWLQWG